MFSIVDTKISHKRCLYVPWIHHPIHHIHEHAQKIQEYICILCLYATCFYYSISIYMELIVFLPISHHLDTLNFFFQAFMFLRPFSSLKFRRLSLKTLVSPDMQVIPSSLCWSNIQSGATPSSPSRSPSWTDRTVFFTASFRTLGTLKGMVVLKKWVRKLASLSGVGDIE